MVNYFIIFIVLISHLLSNETDRKEGVLLFHINEQLESFNIIQDKNSLIGAWYSSNYRPGLSLEAGFCVVYLFIFIEGRVQ